MLGVGDHFRGTWHCLEEDTCADSGVEGSSVSLPQDADRVGSYMSWIEKQKSQVQVLSLTLTKLYDHSQVTRGDKAGGMISRCYLKDNIQGF